MTVAEFINTVGFQVDQNSINAVNSTISNIKGTAMKVLGAIGIGISLTQLNAIAEEFNQINDRINGIVDSSQNAKEVQQSILEAANNCKTSYADMASSVESLYNMNSEVFPIEDAIKFTEYVNKIGLAAGYSSGEISSMQSTLQRMIASGAASSTTIERMMRSTPALAKQLAEAFGVTTSELADLADQGKITAQTLKEAIFSSTESIDIAFSGLNYSISDALLNIRNQWGYWVDDVNSSLLISETLAKTLVKGFSGIMKVLTSVRNGLAKVNDALGGGSSLFKIVAAAAAAFFAVMTWPTIIAHVKTFISLFTKAGRLFNLSTAGVMALVAAIVFLFLIVDDFINFMKGNDSVIGYCFQKAGIDADEMRQKIINIWNNLKTFFVGIWESMKTAMTPVLNWIKRSLQSVFGEDLFAGLGSGLEAVINFLERITTILSNNTGLQDALGKIIVGFVGIAAAVKIGTAAFGGLKSVTGIVSNVAGAFKKATGAAGSTETGGADSGTGFAGMVSDLFEGFASIKTSKILKAVANMAIVLAALTALAAGIMAISPYLANLTDASSLIETLSTITAVGVIGTALTKLASLVGNIPVSQVVKGVANIAIVMAGFTVLAAVITAVAAALSSISNPQQTATLLKTIAAVGVIGAALAGLAGLIGLIPIPIILQGLADIALAIGGFTLIAEAYGVLASIPGFTSLLSTGLSALSTLASGLGNFIGSLVGGIGEGISNSLPAIGNNLSLFAQNLEPFFTICGGADLSGVSSFLGAFSSFVLQMTANDLLSFFTGGLDLSGIAEQLSNFAEKATVFFTQVAEIPEEGFTKATALFESLSNMGNLVKSGGIVQGFTGEVDLSKIATGLAALADESVLPFFEMVAKINEEAFNKATSLFESLSGMGNVMKTGGIAGLIGGSADYGKVAESLAAMTSEGVVSFFTMVSTLTRSTFDKATDLFQALSDISNIKIGKIDTSSIDGEALSTFANGVKGFFDSIAEIDPSVLTAIETALNNFASALFEAASSVGEAAASMQGAVVPVLNEMNDTVITVTDSIKTAMITAWNEAKSSTEDSFRQIGSAMQTQLNNGKNLVITTCNSIKTEMVNVFNGVATSFNTIGINIMQGLVNGINSGKSSVVTAMINAVKSAVTAAKKEAGVASPSKKFRDEVGRYFPEGLAVGIKDNTGVVTNAVSQMIGGLTDGGKDVFNSAINGMKAMASAGTVSMNTAAAATGGTTNNSRNIYQNVEISNTFNGDKAGQQKSAKAMNKAVDDSTALLARGLAYAR